MTAVDLSSYAGLSAMALLTVNILLGLVLSTRFNLPARLWPYGRRKIFDIHNWTAYIALSLVIMHPFILVFSSATKFHLLDVIFPIHSPGQTLYNCFGAIAFYLVFFVVATSYIRKRMTFKLWKAFHYVAYAAGAVLFFHGIIIDPNLKNLPPDLLDGEKVFVEICCLLVVAGSIWRVRYGVAAKRPAAVKVEFD